MPMVGTDCCALGHIGCQRSRLTLENQHCHRRSWTLTDNSSLLAWSCTRYCFRNSASGLKTRNRATSWTQTKKLRCYHWRFDLSRQTFLVPTGLKFGTDLGSAGGTRRRSCGYSYCRSRLRIDGSHTGAAVSVHLGDIVAVFIIGAQQQSDHKHTYTNAANQFTVCIPVRRTADRSRSPSADSAHVQSQHPHSTSQTNRSHRRSVAHARLAAWGDEKAQL